MSTRVEGTVLTVLRITARAKLAAGTACLVLTVTEIGDGLWKFNLSEDKVSRVGYGRLMALDHMAALRRAAEILAEGYVPGSLERGLLEMFAAEGQ